MHVQEYRPGGTAHPATPPTDMVLGLQPPPGADGWPVVSVSSLFFSVCRRQKKKTAGGGTMRRPILSPATLAGDVCLLSELISKMCRSVAL